MDSLIFRQNSLSLLALVPFYAERLEVTSDTMALNNVIYCTLEGLKKQYDLRSIDTFFKGHTG